MSDIADYVREYFDRHARPWLEQAYVPGDLPPAFPLGSERIRLALEGVAAAKGGKLVDLGCGGGHLCVNAARLGFDVVGIDIAPGMIEAAEDLRSRLEPEEATRVRLQVAGFDQSGLETGSVDAVTAMGLLEYMPDDDGLVAEAARLLRPGGRFAVSCRNRLFTLQSANDSTASAFGDGSASELLEELRAWLEQTHADDLQRLGTALAAAADALALAAEADAKEQAPELFHHPSRFTEERRRHTPREIEQAAARHGMRLDAVLPLHPHPLPPTIEPLAPRVYNQLAIAWQRGLDRSPLGLAYSSSFVAVLERRA